MNLKMLCVTGYTKKKVTFLITYKILFIEYMIGYRDPAPLAGSAWLATTTGAWPNEEGLYLGRGILAYDCLIN